MTPFIVVITSLTHLFSTIYRGAKTPFFTTGSGPTLQVSFSSWLFIVCYLLADGFNLLEKYARQIGSVPTCGLQVLLSKIWPNCKWNIYHTHSYVFSKNLMNGNPTIDLMMTSIKCWLKGHVFLFQIEHDVQDRGQGLVKNHHRTWKDMPYAP